MIAKKRKPRTDSRVERIISTGLIISEKFIRQIRPIIKSEYFRTNHGRIISQWCIDYFDIHGTAPGRTIEDIYQDQIASPMADDDSMLAVKSFLEDISSEFARSGQFNVRYSLRRAEQYFREVSLRNMTENVKRNLAVGRVEEAEAILSHYSRPVLSTSKGVDPFGLDIIAASFEDSSEYLLTLPGKLGESIGALARGWLFAVVGAAKSGKTWWLMYIAYLAAISDLNVLFVSMEMKERQIVRRFMHLISGRPTQKWAGTVFLPVWDCTKNQTGSCELDERVGSVDLFSEGQTEMPSYQDFDEMEDRGYKPCAVCKGISKQYKVATWYKKVRKDPLTTKHAQEKAQKIKSELMRGSRFRLVEFPSGSLTMSEFRAYLHNLESYEGFVPDVIVTDYADKMRPERWGNEYRHGINEIWEGHKAIAQELNALVVTASQSNTTRKGEKIKQGSWAEDIRKLNLVDAAMSLNMTADQKRRCVMEAGIMAQRHDYFDLLVDVTVLHQLKIGRPYLDSF
jgi:hypothetical protein